MRKKMKKKLSLYSLILTFMLYDVILSEPFTSFPCDMWLCDCDIVILSVTLTLTQSSKNRKIENKIENKIKINGKMKINRVYHFQLWH